jgi:4-amino-4-deoxy-L-arabinose transferase-like glycosyltransferase
VSRFAPSTPWIIVLGLTVVAAVIRLIGANHAMFADELSTYWIITAKRAAAGQPELHGLGGVLSLLGHVYPGGDTPEISPPLYFALAWMAIQISHAPELVRLPSLIAGIGIVPMTYVLARRLIGDFAALVAAALTTLCPFLIYYSGEARAYSVMMFLLLVTTVAMLRALDTGRTRWWVLYAVASALAMLAHYTAAFVLAGQLLWLLWTHRAAWRQALISNAGAAVLFAPWIPSAIHEYRSPTLKILSALSPFDFTSARLSLEHWVIGFPYSNLSLKTLPGVPALALFGLAAVIALGSLASQLRGSGGARFHIDERLGLVVVLALSVPVGEALQSAVGSHTFGGRNLAGSTVGVLLLAAALLATPRRRLRYVAVTLAIAGFALATAKMLETNYQRPDVAAAARYVERLYRPGDAVIDETVAFSPGPLSAVDTVLRGDIPVFRAGNPAERDHPFGFFDAIVPISSAVRHALARYPSGRIFIVRNEFANVQTELGSIANSRIVTGNATTGTAQRANSPLPPSYREIATRFWPGFPSVRVLVFER